MTQATGGAPTLRFSVLITSVGVLLIAMSLIGGITVALSTTKGLLPLNTFSDVRSAVMRFAYYFVLPLLGGVLLALSGTTLMKQSSDHMQRSYASAGKEKFVKERSRMLDVMLSSDEKKVLEMIKESSNGALQSELVIKSGFSKVKMHRVLKKLEGKELIKRGRFGITNKVFMNAVGLS
jgi:uncharacterized membrane protein